MRKIFLTGLLVATTSFLFAQKIDDIINEKDVDRIERALASDEMRGRANGSAELDKAADFIEAEFKSIGLRTLDASDKFRQSFILVRPKLLQLNGSWNGTALTSANTVILTCQQQLQVSKSSEYEIETIGKTDNLMKVAGKFRTVKKNTIVMVDTAHTTMFARLRGYSRSLFKNDKNVIFVLTNSAPENIQINATYDISEQKMANVVGIIPGKSRKNEYVVFSGHYDHIGVGKSTDGDSIYNGANDDAAGITAVILLAKYFKEIKDNDRTLVFAAFTAEEIGGFGSQYFSKQLDAQKVMAMFNIEMIGTESKWGKNSAYITGYEKTDMGTILQKNLEGSDFTFHPDPYPTQQLFYRSDNATLAMLGVPAHTISTSKMDTEPNYHKVSDSVETLDIPNMTRIIKSIAISAKSIIAGRSTPSRVNVDELR